MLKGRKTFAYAILMIFLFNLATIMMNIENNWKNDKESNDNNDLRFEILNLEDLPISQHSFQLLLQLN